MAALLLSITASCECDSRFPLLISAPVPHCNFRRRKFLHKEIVFSRAFRRGTVVGRAWGSSMVVRMSPPDEQGLTFRSPLEYPLEWETPKQSRMPEIIPKFSPMKTPLAPPLPADPPDPFEEEEEEEEEQQQEEEENPEENPESPDEGTGM